MAGDTVFVADGFYTGFNHMNKSNGTASQPIVYKTLGSNCVINLPKYNNNGINIENNNFIQIYGFHVRNMTKEGIRAVVADNIVINNNNCDSCFRGIFTGYTDNIIVENNTCTDFKWRRWHLIFPTTAIILPYDTINAAITNAREFKLILIYPAVHQE